MMTRISLVVTFAIAALLLPQVAQAQQAQAEIVVPQFNFFGVNTTVVAPDRGGASMGGVNRASEVRNEYGFLPRDTGISRSRLATGTDVRVWVMDFNEMEDALAGRVRHSAALPRGFSGSMQRYAATRPTDKSGKAEEKLINGKPPADVAVAAKEAHAAELLKRGQEAEANGKTKVAILYYKSVVSLDVPSTAQVAQLRLRGLELKLAGR